MRGIGRETRGRCEQDRQEADTRGGERERGDIEREEEQWGLLNKEAVQREREKKEIEKT